jgi:hypothetical protein
MSLIWTDATLEPKRKFKYLVTFTGLPDFQFLAQTCDRPGIKVGAAEHKYFDKTYHHPGRVTWDPNPLNIKLVDIQKKGQNATLDTNEQLLQTLVKSGLQYFSGDGDFRTIGKQAAVGALGDVNITVLNSLMLNTDLPTSSDLHSAAIGGVAEKWTLKNGWLESVKPDGLDYGSEDILTVTIQVRYDWAQFSSNDKASKTLEIK